MPSPPAVATSGGTTTTTPSDTERAAATDQSMARRPASTTYCLGPPKRVPAPPATTTVQTGAGATELDIGSERTQHDRRAGIPAASGAASGDLWHRFRSEEHTSELQSL